MRRRAAWLSGTTPNAAVGATFAGSLDPSLIINSITASQGTCAPAPTVSCDLGGLANGASTTVTVSATPTNSGTLAATVSVSSSSYDPKLSNNQATASTTVTGAFYGAAPSIASISPNMVQAVTEAEIANYGWGAVTVSNPASGGGVSSILPLTIYDLVNVPANSILFDPYGQSLYATIPSTATGITPNSVVAINPFTGAVGTPVAVGSQPTVMAETGDGNDLYSSLSGADSLVQFDLIHQSLAQTITYSGQPTGNGTGTYAATAL